MNKISKLLLFILAFHSTILSAQWVIMDTLAVGANAFAFSSGNKLFLGTSANGFYYSLDTGVTWTVSNQGLTHINIRSVSAKDSLIIIGCYGDVCRSIDYGRTWTSSHSGIVGLDIMDTMILGDSILVGSYGGGVYVSTDFGLHYTAINNGLFDHYVKSLFKNGERLFAGIMYGGSGIFVSDDNGATWMQKCSGIPKNPFNLHHYDAIMSFTKTDQSLFASTWYNGVLKSDDNGESWTAIPVDDHAIWILEATDESIFSGHNLGGIRMSNDNGVTWETCNDGLFAGDVPGLYIYGQYIFAGTHQGYVFRRPLDELITGIQQLYVNQKVAVYPNPVSGNSKIIIPCSPGDKYSLEIFNLAGSLIKSTQGLECDRLILKSNDFSSGIYLFRVTGSDSRSFSGKFMNQ